MRRVLVWFQFHILNYSEYKTKMRSLLVYSLFLMKYLLSFHTQPWSFIANFIGSKQINLLSYCFFSLLFLFKSIFSTIWVFIHSPKKKRETGKSYPFIKINFHLKGVKFSCKVKQLKIILFMLKMICNIWMEIKMTQIRWILSCSVLCVDIFIAIN